MLQAATIKFLKALKKNNSKEWMDKHRADYETARADFAQFIDKLIEATAKFDPTIAHLTAKECMFRINRDIRFSANKAPYKTNMGASINMAGKKAVHNSGYYFHLEPGASFAGGGIWMPESPTLKKIRQEIDYNFNDFNKIVESKIFKNTYGQLEKEFQLTRVPKGYEADNPAAYYLRFKSYIASYHISDEELTSPTLIKNVSKSFQTLQPLIDFLNRAAE